MTTNNYPVKYILFDAANTLIYKPLLWSRILDVLNTHNIKVDAEKLHYNHKLLSECIEFPDRTSFDFYSRFNAELMLSLGIIPDQQLLSDIFNNCTYMPWEKFEDTACLWQMKLPLGVLSNFNTTLPQLLENLFGPIFSNVFVSEEVKARKPGRDFYQYAIDKIGVHPNEILYIGDSIKLDIIPASELGLNACLIDRDGYFFNAPFSIRSLSEIINKVNNKQIPC